MKKTDYTPIEAWFLCVCISTAQSFFAPIPYGSIKKKHRDKQYYLHIFLFAFSDYGQFVETEVKNNKERTNAVVKTTNNICIFEFKMDKNATAKNTLNKSTTKVMPFSTIPTPKNRKNRQKIFAKKRGMKR